METVELTRDCEAVQIPGGDTITLGKGTGVDITQTLGGTYTVRAGMGLFRIGAQDADALGLEVATTVGTDGRDHDQNAWNFEIDESDCPVTVESVHAMLKQCYDPEIPVNIVDLGLVYDTAVDEADDGTKVTVKMTLTAQGCGMGPTIAADAQSKILSLEGVASADVEIVWDPPWNQSMISAEGRETLGM
jgi:probable FeS assembly SUF system protein SufT